MNVNTVDSLIMIGIFSIMIFQNLVYGRFARTSNWRTHDIRVTYMYVYSAFKLYVDGELMRLAVNVRIMQETSEISLHNSCNSNCTVILIYGYHGDYASNSHLACLREAYVLLKS